MEYDEGSDVGDLNDTDVPHPSEVHRKAPWTPPPLLPALLTTKLSRLRVTRTQKRPAARIQRTRPTCSCKSDTFPKLAQYIRCTVHFSCSLLWVMNTLAYECYACRSRLLPKQSSADRSLSLRKMAPEIRNTIYKLTLMEHYDMVYLALQPTNAYTSRRKLVRGVRNGRFGNWGFTTRDRATMRRGTGRNIALLRASKAIYAEGVGLVYGQTFGFYHLGALQAFLLPLGDQAFGLLRRMELRIGDAEWDLLPDTSLQLAHMEELKIRSLDGRFHGTGTMFTRYLTATARHLDTWQITLRNFDCLTGIKIARDLYSCAYPLVQQMAEDGGENGIEKLLNMLDLYEDPQIHLQGFHEVKSRFQPYSAHTYPWFDARARTVHDAMAQELFKIIAEDK